MDKKLKILLVNDDGISSPGIVHLAEMAMQLGEVWVAAPSSQCSAMSQKLTIFQPLEVEEYDFPLPVAGAYSIGGTPADCVKTALKAVLPIRPDVVFSGINIGYNAGFDIAYSGTVGAALEAVMNGVPAIAFSAHENGDPGALEAYLPVVLKELLTRPAEPGCVWNVNFPDCAAAQCKGVLYGRRPAACSFYDNDYVRTGDALSVRVTNPGPDSCREGSDIHAVLHGYVSVGEIRSPLF